MFANVPYEPPYECDEPYCQLYLQHIHHIRKQYRETLSLRVFRRLKITILRFNQIHAATCPLLNENQSE